MVFSPRENGGQGRCYHRAVLLSLALGIGFTLAAVRPSAALAQDAPLTQKQIYVKALKSAALIIAMDDKGEIQGTGTGWLLDPERKLLVTNYHVIHKMSKFRVHFPEYKNGRVIAELAHYAKSGERIDAEPFLTESEHDLAVLKLSSVPDTATPAELAEESPSPGETMHSVGNPGSSNALWVFTTGTVRQVYEMKGQRSFGAFAATIIETQSPVNAGDSGGPVLDESGKLVGVVTSFQQDARLVSHFIDISEVRKLVKLTDELYDPQTAGQFITRAKQRKELSQWTGAVADLTAATRLDDSNSEALSLRGDCFFAQDDFETALADYDEAIKIDSNCKEAYVGRTHIYRSRKDYKEAIASVTKAIRLESDNGYYLFLRGLIHLDNVDPGAAVGDFTRSLKYSPNNSRVLYQRAKAYETGRQYDDAVSDYLAAVKADGEYLDAYTALGDMLLLRANRAKDAVIVFSEAIKHNDQFVYAYIQRGRAYMALEQLELAMQDLNQAVKINPQISHAYDYRGDIHLARRDFDAALEDYVAAVKIDSSNAVFHYDVGNAFLAKGNAKSALGAYDNAIKLAPNFANAYVRRSIAHLTLGNSRDSQADMARAGELNPEYKKLQVKRQNTKYLRITNASKETIEVYVYYYTEGLSGDFHWYPYKPGTGGTPATFEIEAGRTVYLRSEDQKVRGQKFRIWAKGLESNALVTTYRDKDLLVVTDEGYVATEVENFDYTFRD